MGIIGELSKDGQRTVGLVHIAEALESERPLSWEDCADLLCAALLKTDALHNGESDRVIKRVTTAYRKRRAYGSGA